MSEMSRNARRALRAKAFRLANQSSGKVDGSSYGPEETLDADIKTGMRPISRRAYKSGGKVDGDDAKKNAGKSQRKGDISKGADLVDALMNRDVKEANEDREGKKHVGGMKGGGRAAKQIGGPLTGPSRPGGAQTRMKAAQMSGLGNMMTGRSGPMRFKRGGKAEGGELKGPSPASPVPTQRFSFAPAESRMSRAAGLKSGGKACGEGCKCPKCSGGRTGKKAGGGLALGLVSPGALAAKKLLERDGKKHGDDVSSLELNTGGRAARKCGGRAKGGKTSAKGTDINIIISTGPKTPPGPPQLDGGGDAPLMGGIPVPVAPGPGPGGPGPGAAPPAAAAPPPGLGAGPPVLPTPMGRRAGGRAMHHAGAGSGEGRLEKTAIAKRRR